jgi:hypothetical protein
MVLLENGIEPDFYFLGFIKSELLSPKKIESGIMRYVAGVDWKEHIICKALFGHMMSMGVQYSISNGMLMGVNPYSKDVDVMCRIMKIFYLLRDGDFNRFDTRFFEWLFRQMSKFSRHVYYNGTEGQHTARDVILRRLASPRHIVIVKDEFGKPTGAVLRLHGVLSSGHTLTQFLGGFGNQLMNRYVYLMDWCKSIGTDHLSYDVSIHDKPNLEYEEDNMHIFSLGDDNIVAMKEERYGHNSLVVQDNFAEIGVMYTPSDKSPRFTTPWRTLSQVSILKRMFEWDEEDARYKAMLETESILGALYWSETKMISFPQTLDTMLQESGIKGEDFHFRLVRNLKVRAQQEKITLSSPYLDYRIAKSFVMNTTYLPWGDVSTPIGFEEISA